MLHVAWHHTSVSFHLQNRNPTNLTGTVDFCRGVLLSYGFDSTGFRQNYQPTEFHRYEFCDKDFRDDLVSH